jgi:hypothetical protein
MDIIHVLTQSALTVFGPEGVITVHADDDRFDDAVQCVRDQDLAGLIELVKPIEAVREYLSQNERVEIIGNSVFLDGEVVDNYMGGRILQHFRDGNPVEPIINFMINVNANPSRRAQTELLQFLEYGDLPITPAGNFLAYKKVGRGDDYLDCYSRTIDNSIGEVVSMPRNAVQDDPSITCSYGLHFCSLEYVRAFGGSHLMVLEIDPKDVVSIPSDYNNTKGRCCKYTVVGELDKAPENKNHWGRSLVDDYAPPAIEIEFIGFSEEEVADFMDGPDDDEIFNTLWGYDLSDDQYD